MKCSSFAILASLASSALAAPTLNVVAREAAADADAAPPPYGPLALRIREPAPDAEAEPEPYSNLALRIRKVAAPNLIRKSPEPEANPEAEADPQAYSMLILRS